MRKGNMSARGEGKKERIYPVPPHLFRGILCHMAGRDKHGAYRKRGKAGDGRKRLFFDFAKLRRHMRNYSPLAASCSFMRNAFSL